jgi:hypothetical protein
MWAAVAAMLNATDPRFNALDLCGYGCCTATQSRTHGYIPHPAAFGRKRKKFKPSRHSHKLRSER